MEQSHLRQILALLLCGNGVASSAGIDAYEQAMRDYQGGHYAKAVAEFTSAARSGNVQAAEIAGFMYAMGEDLYPGVDRDRSQAARWLDIAARGGRPVARYVYCAVLRKQRVPPGQSWQCFDWVERTGAPAR